MIEVGKNADTAKYFDLTDQQIMLKWYDLAKNGYDIIIDKKDLESKMRELLDSQNVEWIHITFIQAFNDLKFIAETGITAKDLRLYIK